MKKIIRICLSVLCLLFIFAMSSCNISNIDFSSVIREILTTDIPEEDLKIETTIDSSCYIYSDKVRVYMNNDFLDDWLTIRANYQISDDDWDDDRRLLQSNNFEKAAYNDGKLFIFADDKYYMFNIDTYILDKDSEYPYPDYEFVEYIPDEFIKQYPQYETFDWYRR